MIDTKQEKLMQCVAEFAGAKVANKVDVNSKISYLCSALSIVTKNTRFEQDAKDLILAAYPQYYDE